MSLLSPRQTAINMALFSAFITGIGIVLSLVFHSENIFYPVVIAGLSVFIVVYIFTVSFLTNFIYKKISPIYKTIQNVSASKKDVIKDFEDKDIIKEVKKDVMLWAKKKSLEITQLKQLEKYRREFLGNVSHELKTPIFNIQGYILTLLDGGLEDKKVNKLYLQRAEKSINRLISIVNDLESISRLESGEMKLELKKINIIKLFEESFEMHEMLAKDHSIKLKFAKKFEKPIPVYADKQRILEAINNLIVNSIKYGKENGTTYVDFLDMGEVLLVDVTDDGIGIAEKDIPRIFERFYRTDKSRSREMGGTGLGLSIVKHIIEAHQQTINVRSNVGEGSSFAFTLKKA